MARILVIDDERPIREMIAAILEPRGHWVRLAANGREAIREINTTPADLIITDIVMPEMDGIEILKRIRYLSQGVPVIAICGNPSQGHFLHMAQLLGARRTLVKPFLPDLLLNAVEGVLAETKTPTERQGSGTNTTPPQ